MKDLEWRVVVANFSDVTMMKNALGTKTAKMRLLIRHCAVKKELRRRVFQTDTAALGRMMDRKLPGGRGRHDSLPRKIARVSTHIETTESSCTTDYGSRNTGAASTCAATIPSHSRGSSTLRRIPRQRLHNFLHPRARRPRNALPTSERFHRSVAQTQAQPLRRTRRDPGPRIR